MNPPKSGDRFIHVIGTHRRRGVVTKVCENRKMITTTLQQYSFEAWDYFTRTKLIELEKPDVVIPSKMV